jgi:hypothetical protein
MFGRALVLIFVIVVLARCVHRPVTHPVSTCAAELPDTEILGAAQRWLELFHPGVNVNELSPVIYRDHLHCTYSVILPHRGPEAIEDVVIHIDERGRVRNIPECCDLGDCPESCLKSSKDGH